MDGMKQISTCDVLICGLDGLGLEIAKNIILVGVRSVTLYDPEPVTWADLSSHFYADRDSLGKPKAEISREKLATLNSHVLIKVLPSASFPKPVTKDFVAEFTVVILVQTSHTDCLLWGDVCHQADVKLVIANTAGLFGRLFCDFGSEYIVADPTGDENVSVLVESIEKVGLEPRIVQ